MLKVKSTKNDKFKKYSIFRIIGNETPPRDEPDARLNTLKFILDNEPEFPNSIKGWVLNCIHDKERRELIAKILAEKNQYVVLVPLWRKNYLKAEAKTQKITNLIGINRARNLAINHGKLISEFTFLLDGDCLFNQDLWDKACGEIEEDQKKSHKKIYSIPTSRSTFEHALKSNDPMLLAEPMTVHRYDSEHYFDENIPFGEGDKLKFLYKLGHSRESGKHHVLLHENLCKSIGLVHHVTGSDYEIELDQKLRIQLRNESIDKLMWQVDNADIAFPDYAARRHNKPNDYWSKIQGWFDFRGLYSGFAWEQKDGCKIVEVGSWLGASMCYLATEFKNRNKNAVQLYAVDTWRGSNEEIHTKLISEIGGPDALYEKFLKHMQEAKVSDIVKAIRLPSIEASKQFKDESLDVVFIDASHEYKDVLDDIKHWYPKIKKGGIISGHDYVAGHKVSEAGVIRAVNEFFLGKHLEIGQANRTWLHIK